MALAELWWSIASDPMRRDADRLEASRLLADRGWGKAASFEPVEGDPFDLADAEKAAEEFTAKILRLVSDQESDRGKPGSASPGGDTPCRVARILRNLGARTSGQPVGN